MYYSFRCTYCGRLFYTYSDDKEEAANTLYKAIKQHLVDYDEDRKEYEMDDGEEADSNQIYYEMEESSEVPPGGYEAVVSSGGSSGSSASSGGMMIFYIILILLVIGVIILFFMGGISFI